MPDIFYLISRWWKQMLVVIVIALVTVGAIVFFLPDKYLSVATALPANPALTDRSSVFSDNLQIPSPSLGTEEELDIIVGTGQLDTVYIAVVTAFNLWDHYKTEEKGDAAITKAAYLLKKNTSIAKSGYGELKVRVWDTDKNLAPQLANAIIDQLDLIHQSLQNKYNNAILAELSAKADSADKYHKLLEEYRIIVNAKSPALLVVEKARPSPWPDKPKRAMILVGTAILSFLFSLLAALVLERRKRVV
jgi:uncharacterized protein involved in exopolysaccharide biosynthesis